MEREIIDGATSVRGNLDRNSTGNEGNTQGDRHFRVIQKKLSRKQDYPEGFGFWFSCTNDAERR